MTDETVRIQKISGQIAVTRELLEDCGAPIPISFGFLTTPEEQAAHAARRQAAAAEAQPPILAEHAALIAQADGLRRAVLELHGPVFRELDTTAHCEGCDAYGYEVDDTEFPCRTYELARDFGGSL